MPRSWIAAAGLISISLGTDACAEPTLRAGARELSGHISPDFEGAIGDMIFVQAGYGWFVRDALELRGVLSYTLLEDVSGEDTDYKMKSLDAIGEYHFDFGSRFVPYAGLGIGWAKSLFANVEESALTYSPRAGVKCFLADKVALDFEVAYRLASADVFVNDFTAEDSDLSLALGFRVLFVPSGT